MFSRAENLENQDLKVQTFLVNTARPTRNLIIPSGQALVAYESKEFHYPNVSNVTHGRAVKLQKSATDDRPQPARFISMLQRTDHKKKDKGGQQKQNMLSLDPLVNLHLCVPHVARASAPMDTVFHIGIDIPALGFHHISQHHWPHKPRCMTRYLKPSSPQSIR